MAYGPRLIWPFPLSGHSPLNSLYFIKLALFHLLNIPSASFAQDLSTCCSVPLLAPLLSLCLASSYASFTFQLQCHLWPTESAMCIETLAVVFSVTHSVPPTVPGTKMILNKYLQNDYMQEWMNRGLSYEYVILSLVIKNTVM